MRLPLLRTTDGLYRLIRALLWGGFLLYFLSEFLQQPMLPLLMIAYPFDSPLVPHLLLITAIIFMLWSLKRPSKSRSSLMIFAAVLLFFAINMVASGAYEFPLQSLLFGFGFATIVGLSGWLYARHIPGVLSRLGLLILTGPMLLVALYFVGYALFPEPYNGESLLAFMIIGIIPAITWTVFATLTLIVIQRLLERWTRTSWGSARYVAFSAIVLAFLLLALQFLAEQAGFLPRDNDGARLFLFVICAWLWLSGIIWFMGWLINRKFSYFPRMYDDVVYPSLQFTIIIPTVFLLVVLATN